jgi:ABC-type Mn2+/Zn2+ transport system ATPase subunit
MESEKRESTEKKYSLTWENLSLCTQEEIPILRNLNGCVESGDFLAIMGPSGAGKSSLLSILTARLRKNNTRLAIQGNVSHQRLRPSSTAIITASDLFQRFLPTCSKTTSCSGPSRFEVFSNLQRNFPLPGQAQTVEPPTRRAAAEM